MWLMKKLYSNREVPPSPQKGSALKMRIGRVEREEVVQILNDAYLEDKIFPHEHGERLEKVLQATTQEELNDTISDLVPVAPPIQTPTPSLSPQIPTGSVEKVKVENLSPVETQQEPDGDSVGLFLLLTVMFLSIVLLVFPFMIFLSSLTKNSSENFSILQNHVSAVSEGLAEEALRANEPLTLVAGEGLGVVRAANGEPLPEIKSEEIQKGLTQNEENFGNKWVVVSDGDLLTFTTNYGFIHSNEVTCTLNVDVPVGKKPVKNCAVERVK